MVTRGEPATTPDASVIVVNYNGAERLSTCLDALLEDKSVASEIIVVDNASTDQSLEMLESRNLPESVQLIRSSSNLGYAGAVNHAFPHCAAEVVAVLNMDTVPEPGWLHALVEFLRSTPTAGAVNPLVVSDDGRTITAAGQNIHVTGLGFNRMLGRPPEAVGTEPFNVPGIQGSAFALRSSTFKLLGGMDETGFLYHEDVNLSWMIRLAGLETYCVPASVVRHHYHLSMYPAKYYLLERNRWILLLVSLRASTFIFISPWLIATELMALFYCTIRGPAFWRAKAESFKWLAQRRNRISDLRGTAQYRRTVGDWRVLRSFRWFWEWDQFFTLAKERGESTRQPKGGIPNDVLPQELRKN